MKENRKRKRKLTSFIAAVIALLMLLMPLAAFAEDTSVSDSSSTGSSDSSSNTESSSASDDSDSSTNDNTNAGDESTKSTEDKSGDTEDGDSNNEQPSEESADDSTSNEEDKNLESDEAKEKNNEEVNEEGSKDSDSEETEKEISATDKTSEEQVEKDQESDLGESSEEVSLEDEPESSVEEEVSTELNESAGPAGEETSEQGENSDEVNTDQKFDGNTYSAVIEHVEDHADYPADYEEYLGLDELRYFEATITEIGESRVGSAQITVPDEFDLTDGSILDGTNLGYLNLAFSALIGYTLNHDEADYASNWEAVADSGSGTISLWSKSVDYYLYQGHQVTVGFQAKTPDQITAEAEQKTSDQFVEYDDNGDYKIGIYDFGVTAWTNATTDDLDSEGNRSPLYEDGSNAGEGSGVGVSNDRLNTMSDDHSQLQVWVGDDDFFVAKAENEALLEAYLNFDHDEYDDLHEEYLEQIKAFNEWLDDLDEHVDYNELLEAFLNYISENGVMVPTYSVILNDNYSGGSYGQIGFDVFLFAFEDDEGNHKFYFNIPYQRQSGGGTQDLEIIVLQLPDGFSSVQGVPEWNVMGDEFDNYDDPRSDDNLELGWNYYSNGVLVWKSDGNTPYNPNNPESYDGPVELFFTAELGNEPGSEFKIGAIYYSGGSNTANDFGFKGIGGFNIIPPNEPTSPPEEPEGVFFTEFTYLQFLGEPVDNNPFNEDPTPDDDPEDPDDTIVLPEIIGPFTPLTTPLAAPPVAPPVELPEVPVAAVPAAEEPVEEVVEEVPEVTQVEVVEPEEPQVLPVAEQQSTNYWPLLLLLIPGLLWFLWARLVLVRVPNQDGEYKTVARKLARRKDKRWYVEIGKQLDEYLVKHGEVMVDFRGGLIKEAKKAIYTGETVLSTGEVRYAVINRQRLTNWVEKLNEKAARLAG